ncbi:ABC transporter ATP-binding protein [Aeromicrobium phragmitis]|uniref:ABC transporter ATP-binding protein n=1 Tax=Aeromicrobium phragmitis TaxID=2478914 RepID=UPI001407B8E4|nr:ABC transporter ATP-binding protein [Aeromicrobium phragmitis]
MALELKGITKRFPGVTANDGIDLDVKRGEVHALLGENGAGKSTLMNIVFGLVAPDSGEIIVGGKRVTPHGPQEAAALGIGMVHQHFMLVPDMDVIENVALTSTRWPRMLKRENLRSELDALATAFGLGVSSKALVETLSVGERQRVEILKLLYRGAQLIILDEPSAALTPTEWQSLTAFLRTMTAEGKAVVLITHKLDEIMDVADRCTVLRDGRVVTTLDVATTDKATLARTMVGRDVSLRGSRAAAQVGDVVLEVEDVTLDEGGRRLLDGVSLQVRSGEVVGIAGVSGNGQNELVDVIVGLSRAATGRVTIDGREYSDLLTRGFTAAGGALVPESRHSEGVALDLSIWENLVAKELTRFTRHGVVDMAAARRHAVELSAMFDIRSPSVETGVKKLSGGNQQKVVLARELSRDPRLVIMFQPTLGLDAGAIEGVYRRINEQKLKGAAVLLISYELDEILSLTDRFAVMFGGRLGPMMTSENADVERVGLLMGGGR